MNFQDIAEFLDLVKNPEKYEAKLKAIQDSTEDLNKRIAVLGKVGEIDGLKQKAEKLVSVAQKKAETIEAEAVEALSKRQAVYDDLFVKLKELESTVATKSRDADAKLESASTMLKQVEQRTKELDKREVQLDKDKVTYSNLLTEYEEKVAKLRSVMN